LRLRPAWAEVWGERGWLRLVRGNLAGARADVDRAIALDPTHVGLGFTRAETLARLGDVSAAVRQLARSADLNPDWDGPAVDAALRFTRAPELLSELTSGSPRRAELLRVAQARQ
jgi:predicted Zn-dependent protease